MSTKFSWIKTIILMSFSFIFGLFFHYLISNHKPLNPFSEVRNQGKYQFINPLLECENNNISQDKNLDNLKNQLEVYINKQIKNNTGVNFASVYYRDLNNGPWFGINHGELFSPASLIKVPLLITYYKMAQSDPDLLNKKLMNTKNYDPLEQNIIPELRLNPNQEYTIDELLTRMIVDSDNLAHDLLLENMDNQKLIQIYNDLGIDISLAIKNPMGNVLSVKQYASFFRILFNSSYLNQDMSEKALKLLNQVKYRKALRAGVPSNIPVSHKFGERRYTQINEYQLHDCGIVYLPQKPYLLCIMTRGFSFDKEADFIKQISSIVFQATSQARINNSLPSSIR